MDKLMLATLVGSVLGAAEVDPPAAQASQSYASSVVESRLFDALASFVLPGSGEWLQRDPMRAGIFLAADALCAGIATAGYLLRQPNMGLAGGTGMILVSIASPVDVYFFISRPASGSLVQPEI